MQIKIKDMKLEREDHPTIIAYFRMAIFKTEESERPFQVTNGMRLMKGVDNSGPWITYPAVKNKREIYEKLTDCPCPEFLSDILDEALRAFVAVQNGTAHRNIKAPVNPTVEARRTQPEQQADGDDFMPF